MREAEIPGGGGIATARALAGIWSAAVTSTDGTRLLDDATLALALKPETAGLFLLAAAALAGFVGGAVSAWLVLVLPED